MRLARGLAAALVVASTLPMVGCPYAGLVIVATTIEQSMDLQPQVPALVLDIDPQFQIRVRVDRVVRGESPVAPGSELALLIHSPARTYMGQDPRGKTYTYRFHVTRDKEGKPEYELLWATLVRPVLNR